jgi:hypothetical protein
MVLQELEDGALGAAPTDRVKGVYVPADQLLERPRGRAGADKGGRILGLDLAAFRPLFGRRLAREGLRLLMQALAVFRNSNERGVATGAVAALAGADIGHVPILTIAT